MANNSPDYKVGYKDGYSAGYTRGKNDATRHELNARWVFRKGDWYCSNCNTKYKQEHDDFCCKCGARMNKEEAD